MKSNKLFLHLTGGLGNQMFQTVAGLSVAGKRDLVVFSDLGKPRLNQESQPEIFNYDLQGHIKYQANSKGKNYLVTKILGYLLRTGINPVGIEQKRLFMRIIKLVANVALSIYKCQKIRVFVSQDVGLSAEINPKANLLIGYFQSYHWQRQVDIQQLFQCKQFHQTSTYKHFDTLAQDNTVLAVHVRLGDYLLEESFGIPSKKYYSNAISYVQENVDISQIWVFTDSPDLVSDYLDISPHLNVLTIPNDLSSSVETLELMRLAHHYVIGNSSFSWWGARLSRNSLPIVVAPKPWFKNMASPTEITPPEWVTLDAWPPSEP